MNLENLRTVRNYSLMRGMTTANVYRMIRENKIDSIAIDGVKFVVLREDEV